MFKRRRAVPAIAITVALASCVTFRGSRVMNVTTRSELQSLKVWTDFPVRFVRTRDHQESVAVGKTVTYSPPSFPGRNAFLGVVKAPSGDVFLTPAHQSFYVAEGDKLVACLVGAGTFLWRESFARDRRPGEFWTAATVRRLLATLDDNELFRRDVAGHRVRLDGVPYEFFTVRSAGGSHGALPTVIDAESDGDIITLWLQSDGAVYDGVFRVDMKTERLLSATATRRPR